jgi:hypothetical protein
MLRTSLRGRRSSKSLIGASAAIAAIALTLAACATQTPYQASGPDTRHGYAEQQLAENRYRVKFSGNSATPRETVENYLLYRAAEVTLSKGYTHFVFAAQDTEAKTYYRESFDDWPRAGFYWHNWPWGHGFGAHVGTSTSRPITSYTAYADVILLAVGEAQGNPEAFDARSVLDSIGPYIRTQQQQGS